jgi:uncharacterized protein (TIGR03083 family)
VEYVTYVEHVRADGRRLLAVADGELANDVPSCPGWSVRDLVRHVAEVYEHKIACTELGRAPDPWPPAWPEDRDPVGWLGYAHDRLIAMFERSRSDTPSATWWPPDQTVGFWARRMAQETVVHRIDGEQASGAVTPVDPDLAVDGVDEVLAIFLAGDWSEDPDDALTGQRVAISTGGRSWRVDLTPDAVSVTLDGASADATLGGDPADVLLWLWGRLPDERVTRSGDSDAIRLLRARLVQATQ